MNYQVLARKYRPHNFQEMAGQEHVLRALTNALDQQRLHHAYLFTGTRGTGKTTLARIIAKCLNCESGVTSKPCGTCNACQQIDEGRFIDLLEIDAASRTKVEDTRELLENVQYAPTYGRYKIYLIDEVHMLSGHSFNALLKTLEEPPPHVKFLLATTDPQRLPVTVLSRCLQFNLKNLSPEQIKQQLEHVLKLENIIFESAALALIARAANGSLRDALSLLDQAIAYGGNELREADVRSMLGSIEQTHLIQLLTALATQDAKTILAVIATLAEHGADFNNALEELLSVLHKLAIAHLIPESLSTEEQSLAALVKQLSAEDIQLFYQIGLIGRRDLPLAPTPQSGFEMILLRMLAFRPIETEEKINEPELSSRINNQESPSPARAKQSLPLKKESSSSSNWPDLITKLNLSGFAQMLAMHCVIKEYKDNKMELLLDPNQVAVLNPKQQTRINEALNQHFGKTINLQINVGVSNIPTPARLQADAQAKQQKAAAQSLEKDTNIQALVKTFGATITPGSIQVKDTESVF